MTIIKHFYHQVAPSLPPSWSSHEVEREKGLEEARKIILCELYCSEIRTLIVTFHRHAHSLFVEKYVVHPEPDILECEVKWALESITTNKLVEVMEFQLSYFKSWKMMLWKCCTQYVSKFGKLSSGHRTGKGQFSFQSQRKAMPKKAQTTTQ